MSKSDQPRPRCVWTATRRLLDAAASACLHASTDPRLAIAEQLDASEAAESILDVLRTDALAWMEAGKAPWEGI